MRIASVNLRPRTAKTSAVVVEAEDVLSVVKDTCAPPSPDRATEGTPSLAASHAAPLFK